MKKAVFLFLFVLFFVSITPVEGLNSEVYSFSNYEIRLDSLSNDNNGKGYHIEKLGENPFQKDIVLDNSTIKIDDVKEIDGNHIFYGFAHLIDGDTYYDAYFLVLDELGEIIAQEVVDFGDLETIVEVLEIDNIIMIHYVQHTDDVRDIIFYQNYFVTYDYTYNEISQITTNVECTKTEVVENMYLFSIDFDRNWSGGITSDLDIIYPNEALDIPTDSEFIDSVSILFLNKAVLNEEYISNGITIDYPGIYELEYNEFTYKFFVVPTVSGVEDDKTYNESVTPHISSGNIFLNNDLFVSGTTINEPGNYTLKITGANNYIDQYDFVITSNITGILHNQTYSEPVEVTFEGKGYLNNAYIESPYTISEEGEYILKIQGANNYLETFYFNVDLPEEETSLITFIQKYDVVFLGVVVISGGLILKKK